MCTDCGRPFELREPQRPWLRKCPPCEGRQVKRPSPHRDAMPDKPHQTPCEILNRLADRAFEAVMLRYPSRENGSRYAAKSAFRKLQILVTHRG